jgi:phosphoglycolate phosphatase-like HAD superfamily hydrolase
MAKVTAGGLVFDVDAVAFDKDGTLIDLDAAWGPAARAWVETAAGGDAGLMADLSARMGLDLDRDHLVAGGLFAVGTVGQLYDTTLEVLAEHGLADPVSVAEAARRTSALAGEKGNLEPLGDVAGALTNLDEARVRLAIVSSDDRQAIDAAIEALGVHHLVEAVVSGDQGLAPKPAPDALLEAAGVMAVDPSRMLYVGDSWVDAEAGNAAGVAGTVLVGEVAPEVARLASVVIGTVDDLRPA